MPGLEGRIPQAKRNAVVLATIGSLGDLYPVLLLARALEDRGIEARLALSPDDCERAEQWGLLATPVTPSEAEVSAMVGMTRDEIAAAILHDPGPLMNRMAIPMLPDITPALEELCEGASCVVGTAFALGAPLVAEKMGLPYVPLLLQPMMTFSPEDPPYARGMGIAAHPAKGKVSLAWNRALMAGVRAILRGRHRGPLNAARRKMGLPPYHGTPLIDFGAEVPFQLGLWSDMFSAISPSAEASGIRAVGFPPAPEGRLPDHVVEWLADGPPPLVVTLGSIAQALGGDGFWTEAAEMARAMGLRAVLLHGTATPPTGPDILALPYAPHAPLFPHAAAVVHHGGIGTTAEALRAGKPQLVVPVGGDQPDNAARLERLGVATVTRLKGFRGRPAAPQLSQLLDTFDYARAGTLAEDIREEDGAALAARLLERVVLAQ